MIVFSQRLAFGRPRSHAISDKLEQWPAGPFIENAYRRSGPRLLLGHDRLLLWNISLFNDGRTKLIGWTLPDKLSIWKKAKIIEEDAVAKVSESPWFNRIFDKPLEALDRFSDCCAMRMAAPDACVSRRPSPGRNMSEG